MAVFPMFIELEKEICLIIGGGKVALRKAEVLLDMGAEVHVISRRFEPELLKLQSGQENRECCSVPIGNLECHEINEGPLAAAVWLEQNARKEGIGNVIMLICATDDERVNHQTVLWARKHGIPANSATNPADCDFYFPSVVRRGNLMVGISTGGRTPSLSRMVSRQIQETLPDWYETLAETGVEARERIHQATSDSGERKEILVKVLRAALEDRGRLTEEDIDKIIRENRSGEEND